MKQDNLLKRCQEYHYINVFFSMVDYIFKGYILYNYNTDVMSTIEQVLAKERLNSQQLNVQALSNLIYSPDGAAHMKSFGQSHLQPHDPNDFNKSRVDIIKKSVQQHMEVTLTKEFRTNTDTLLYLLHSSKQHPLSLHCTMFLKCIQMMGTERQQTTWFKKTQDYQIFGCYAQTQLGHGSDVQSLQTTATYVLENDTFMVNTPSVSAAKCWPGDLGIYATHALVFAQLIVQGKNHGVHPFIVPIRDNKTFQSLPGVEVGDIGPKFGFHSKDNGYLIMTNVEIPKYNMLRRFTSVSKTGNIKNKGDPKVGYATMMIIRQIISNQMPRIYAKAITVAARYSVFRTQFLTSTNMQIPIIDYQTQKDKIISRIAEYMAVSIGGTAVKELSTKNLKIVMEKNDFSLMSQTHACLCLGKALFTEIVYDGMEICRKACGGHGFSHYSGIPTLLSEYASNLTMEGQNTILYLQVTRYLLKNYKYAMTNPSKVGESSRYLIDYNDIMEKRVDNDRQNWKNWNLQDIELLLTQAACYNLSLVTEKMLNKPEGTSNLDVWNKIAGCEIKKAAMSHGNIYIFSYFKKAFEKDTNINNKAVVKNIVLLFGANTILNSSSHIIQGGFINPDQLWSLKNFKETLLESIRPHMITLIDSFLMPDHFVNSALIQGNPYDNYLQLARKNELNAKVQQAGLIIRNNIVPVTVKHMPKL